MYPNFILQSQSGSITIYISSLVILLGKPEVNINFSEVYVEATRPITDPLPSQCSSLI